ncbi:MAG: PAS domain-containing protein, partial [Acidobacteriota bacterium]
IALVALLDDRRAWFKSVVGLTLTEVPRDRSFCATAITQGDLFVVADAAADPRFSGQALVTGEPRVRFYAGVPLRTPEGQALGTLAVLDRVPRDLTPAQADALRVLGRQVMAQLELRRQAVELTQNQARLIQVFRDCPVPLAIHRWPERTFVEVNAAFTSLLGWTSDELRGRTMVELGILDAEKTAALAASLTERRALRDVEITVTTRAGERREVLAETALVEVGGAQQAITTLVDITGRRRTEDALRASHEQSQIVARATNDAIWDWNLDTDALSWNENYEALFGYRPEDTDPSLRSWSAFLHPDDADRVLRGIHGAIDGGGQSWSDEYRFRRRDGSYAAILDRGYIIRDSSGAPARMIGAMQDISERTRIAEALRESEERLRLALEAAQMGTFDWEVPGNRIAWSRWHEQLWGFETGEFDGTYQAFASRLHPDDAQPLDDEVARCIAARETFHREFRVVWPGGSTRWVAGRGEFTFAADGSPLRMRGTVMDISERRKAEARIRHLNRVYAVLSETNETIVRERDPAAMLRAACRIAVEHGQFCMAWIGLVEASGRVDIAAHAGATEDTLALVRALAGGDGRKSDCAFTAQAVENGEHGVCNDIGGDPRAAGWRDAALQRGYRAMASFPLKTGARVRGTFNLYAGESGIFDDEEIRLLDELATDISFALDIHEQEAERRRVGAALRESEERFRQLAENIQEVFWMTEPSSRQVIYVSPAFEKVWGRTCASLYASSDTWEESLHPDDRARVVAANQAAQRSGRYDETYRILRPDGSERWIHDRAFPIRGAGGQIVRTVGTAEDITERRQLEQQLRQSQKMDAIGQLAGGVAHDFNNILAAIMMQAELAASEANPPETRELLEDITASAERAANLTRQLLAFSRRQVMQSQSLDLNEIVISLAKMLQRILGEDVSLQLTLHPQRLVASVDAGMLDQVLLNLVVNARDAMPHGGRLVIETGDGMLSEAAAALIPDAAPGRHLRLRVTDTGRGIDAAHLPRIFEPFFTTKEPGKGTGLGLATVFGIIKQHGGWLAVDSRPGHTTFNIFLPADSGSGGTAIETVPLSRLRRGTGTILLVEDEPSVRQLTCIVLERQGYRVLEASHGAEALRIWDEHPGEVHLLLTDIVMPEG